MTAQDSPRQQWICCCSFELKLIKFWSSPSSSNEKNDQKKMFIFIVKSSFLPLLKVCLMMMMINWSIDQSIFWWYNWYCTSSNPKIKSDFQQKKVVQVIWINYIPSKYFTKKKHSLSFCFKSNKFSCLNRNQFDLCEIKKVLFSPQDPYILFNICSWCYFLLMLFFVFHFTI